MEKSFFGESKKIANSLHNLSFEQQSRLWLATRLEGVEWR